MQLEENAEGYSIILQNVRNLFFLFIIFDQMYNCGLHLSKVMHNLIQFS